MPYGRAGHTLWVSTPSAHDRVALRTLTSRPPSLGFSFLKHKKQLITQVHSVIVRCTQQCLSRAPTGHTRQRRRPVGPPFVLLLLPSISPWGFVVRLPRPLSASLSLTQVPVTHPGQGSSCYPRLQAAQCPSSDLPIRHFQGAPCHPLVRHSSPTRYSRVSRIRFDLLTCPHHEPPLRCQPPNFCRRGLLVPLPQAYVRPAAPPEMPSYFIPTTSPSRISSGASPASR